MAVRGDGREAESGQEEEEEVVVVEAGEDRQGDDDFWDDEEGEQVDEDGSCKNPRKTMGSLESLWVPTRDSAILSTNSSNRKSFSSPSELSAVSVSIVRTRVVTGDASRDQKPADPDMLRRRLRLADLGES